MLESTIFLACCASWLLWPALGIILAPPGRWPAGAILGLVLGPIGALAAMFLPRLRRRAITPPPAPR